MYADTVTRSMRSTIDETNRRRKKQQEYNKLHNITPKQIEKQERNILGRGNYYTEEFLSDTAAPLLADPILEKMNKAQLLKAIDYAKKEMENSARELDFVNAAKHRDEMNNLKRILEKKETEHK